MSFFYKHIIYQHNYWHILNLEYYPPEIMRNFKSAQHCSSDSVALFWKLAIGSLATNREFEHDASSTKTTISCVQIYKTRQIKCA